MSLTSNLPELPEGVNGCVVQYNAETDTYLMHDLVFDPQYVYFSSDDNYFSGKVDGNTIPGTIYHLEDGAWVSQGSSHFALYGDYKVLFTTANLVKEDGNYIAYSSDISQISGATSVGSYISSGFIVGSTLSPMYKLAPLLIVPVIGFLAFRKGYAFLKSHLKGA